jgi:tRNA A-37 threonylcarbamoyl transferase component Bud32
MTTPTVIGRYEVMRELGRGAMGTVYLARDTALTRLVALKTFRAPQQLDPEDSAVLRRRTLREAQRAGTLSHPNVITIYDVVEIEPGAESFYIVMEYVDGQGLDARMRARGPMSISEAAPLVAQIASALDHLHARGIVHRDVKPGNALVTEDGRVKITDFGIARSEDPSQTLDTEVYGTPYYMAPEQIQGQPVDGRSDVFSLGVVLYEMLTGKRPFPGSTVAQVTHRIVYGDPEEAEVDGRPLPAALQQVLRGALARDPADRFASAGALATAVQDLAETSGALDLDATTAIPRGRWLARRPAVPGSLPRTRMVIAVVAAVVVMLLGAGLLYLRWQRGVGPPGDTAELQARQVSFVKLVSEGKQMLANGDPQSAAVLFQVAEGLGIDPAGAQKLRDQAQRQAGEQTATIDPRQQLAEGRYDQMVAAYRQLLETRAGREKAAGVLADVQRALAESEHRAGPARRPQPRPTAAVASAPAAAPPAPEPATTVDYGVLHVELQSQAPEGILTVWIDEKEVARYPFAFYERAGLFRKRPVPGSWAKDLTLPAGPHSFRVLVVRPGEAGRVSKLAAPVVAGSWQTLAISLPAAGEPVVELR